MIIVAEPAVKMARFTAFGEKKTCPLELKYNRDKGRFAQQIRKTLCGLAGREPLEAVSFRIIFGGKEFNRPVRVRSGFAKKLAAHAGSSPLYTPSVCEFIELCCGELKDVPVYAFFETSLFSRLPAGENVYPLGREYFESSGITKRGYHGTYHGAHARMFGAKRKVISIVLDRHTTVCAIDNKVPLTISLGCTPLEGIMSLKSCGDIDPGVIVYLMKEHGMSMYKIDDILKNESGFYGMTGYNSPLDELVTLYGRNDKVTLAFDVYANHILKYIGDCAAVMNGFDTVVFAGKFAVPLGRIIYGIIKKLSFFRLNLAEMPWDTAKDITCITSKDSERSAYLHTRDEAGIICGETKRLLHRAALT